jgi:hypothetical protein
MRVANGVYVVAQRSSIIPGLPSDRSGEGRGVVWRTENRVSDLVTQYKGFFIRNSKVCFLIRKDRSKSTSVTKFQ